jgi:hypothetical protein
VIEAKELNGLADKEKSPKKCFWIVSEAKDRPRMLYCIEKEA